METLRTLEFDISELPLTVVIRGAQDEKKEYFLAPGGRKFGASLQAAIKPREEGNK